MTAQDTEVGKWLEANGAGQFAETFFDQGYEDKADLTQAVIDSIVKAKTPGLAAKLGRLLAADQPKPREPGTPPPIPALPAGTVLDLTQAQITAPNVPAFTLPSELSVSASDQAVVSPLDLADTDWMIIAGNSRLLYAYTMEDFTDDPPPQANKAVLDWVVPSRRDFIMAEQLEAEVTADISYTESTANYVRSGFDKESASASYMGCSASFEREHKERQAKASYDKNLQMIGRWYYPRAALTLDERCTRASANFVADVKAALASPNPTQALLKVFSEYGTAIPAQVTLGGMLYFTHTQHMSGEVDEKSAQDTISGAVSIKVGGAEGTTGASVGTGSAQATAEHDIADHQQFKVRGGDSTLASAPQMWPNSVKDPRHWAVVGRKGLRSTVDLLDPDLRQQVIDLWDRVPFPPAILPPVELPGDDHSLPVKGPGFLLASRQIQFDGERGWAMMVCSSTGDPSPDDPGAVAAYASIHQYEHEDIFYVAASLCLPVPAGTSYHAQHADTSGGPPRRSAYVQTRLSFGAWRPAFPNGPDLPGGATTSTGTAASDGFLLVSIHAENGERGSAIGSVSGKRMAGASVHWYTDGDCWIQDASFCLPVPAGAAFAVETIPTCGSPRVRAWWLPSTSRAWKFQPAEPRSCNTALTAATDGIATAFMSTDHSGDRGFLKIELNDSAPWALSSAAVHRYEDGDRWIYFGSAMMPLTAGASYKITAQATFLAPGSYAYWTPIVPA